MVRADYCFQHSEARSTIRFSLHSSCPSVESLLSPFSCNSSLGSWLRFASATIRTHDALPVPTMLSPKTGLYDIYHHLNKTSETIVSKPKSQVVQTMLVFVTPLASLKPDWFFIKTNSSEHLHFPDTFNLDWNANSLHPFVLPRNHDIAGGIRWYMPVISQ